MITRLHSLDIGAHDWVIVADTDGELCPLLLSSVIRMHLRQLP